jgi:hypothetical protein
VIWCDISAETIQPYLEAVHGEENVKGMLYFTTNLSENLCLIVPVSCVRIVSAVVAYRQSDPPPSCQKEKEKKKIRKVLAADINTT